MSAWGVAGKFIGKTGKAYLGRLNLGQAENMINMAIARGSIKRMVATGLGATPGRAAWAGLSSASRAMGRGAKKWAWTNAGGNLNRAIRMGTVAGPALFANKVRNDYKGKSLLRRR